MEKLKKRSEIKVKKNMRPAHVIIAEVEKNTNNQETTTTDKCVENVEEKSLIVQLLLKLPIGSLSIVLGMLDDRALKIINNYINQNLSPS